MGLQLAELAGGADVDRFEVRLSRGSLVAETLSTKRYAVVVCVVGVSAARRRQRCVVPGQGCTERLVLSPDGVQLLIPDVRTGCKEAVVDVAN